MSHNSCGITLLRFLIAFSARAARATCALSLAACGGGVFILSTIVRTPVCAALRGNCALVRRSAWMMSGYRVDDEWSRR
jgi:hypothetical protein